MKRREFLKFSAGTALAGVYSPGELLKAAAVPELGEAFAFYVSSSGSDKSPGTKKLPFATLHRAQEAVRQSRKGTSPVKVLVREGTYYLKSTLRGTFS